MGYDKCHTVHETAVKARVKDHLLAGWDAKKCNMVCEKDETVGDDNH